MLMKVIIVLMMLAIVASLGSALFYLLKTKDTGANMAKALSYRIGFSLLLFVLLLVAFAMGWLKPHGIS